MRSINYFKTVKISAVALVKMVGPAAAQARTDGRTDEGLANDAGHGPGRH